jgi:anti-sigma factor RsiW
MRCAKVEKALPLHVGHDLDAGGSREVSAHLASCDRCRALEAGLRDSRAWLETGPRPPMDESDYSAVHRGVWQRIEAEDGIAGHRAPRAGRLVLGGGLLAGALLAVFLLVRPRPEAFRPGTRRPAASPVTAPTVVMVQVAGISPEAAPGKTIRPVPRARVRPAAPIVSPSVVKIEFQTANPGVRIIWLVKKGDGVPSAAAGRSQEVS